MVFYPLMTYGFVNAVTPEGEHPCVARLFLHDEYLNIYDPANRNARLRTDALLQACGISNIDQALGNNFKRMPGIIYCCSLSSPPVNIQAPVITVDMQSIKVGARGESIQEWLTAYLFNQLNAMICHYVANLPPPHLGDNWSSWGGFNIFLDISPSVLVSYNCDIAFLLYTWKNTNTNCRIGEEEFQHEIENVKHAIIELLRIRTQNIGSIPLYEFFAVAVYNIAGFVKRHWNTKVWLQPIDTRNQRIQYHVANPVAQDHNIRIWLYKRKVRFLGHRETTEDGIQGTNISPKCWLGIGQYIRYILFHQIGFRSLHDNYAPIQKMIFRDAHASTTSLLSSNLDRTFFDSVGQERVIMFGVGQWYKKAQHMVIDDRYPPIQKTVLNPATTFRLDDYKVGIYAGAVWAFNYFALDGRPLILPEFVPEMTQPFSSPLNHRGRPITIPSIITEAEYPTNDGNAAYWGYGLDEHILGYILRNRNSNPTLYSTLRVLTYNINFLAWDMHWSQATRGNNITYYNFLKVFLEMLCRSLPNTPFEQGYFNRILTTSATSDASHHLLGPQITFETLFGNVGNNNLRGLSIGNDARKAPDNSSYPREEAKLRAGLEPFGCRIRNYNRYDRFDYYNLPGVRIFQGVPKSLTNSDVNFLENLQLALRLPILPMECGTGVSMYTGRGPCQDDVAAYRCPPYPSATNLHIGFNFPINLLTGGKRKEMKTTVRNTRNGRKSRKNRK